MKCGNNKKMGYPSIGNHGCFGDKCSLKLWPYFSPRSGHLLIYGHQDGSSAAGMSRVVVVPYNSTGLGVPVASASVTSCSAGFSWTNGAAAVCSSLGFGFGLDFLFLKQTNAANAMVAMTATGELTAMPAMAPVERPATIQCVSVGSLCVHKC